MIFELNEREMKKRGKKRQTKRARENESGRKQKIKQINNLNWIDHQFQLNYREIVFNEHISVNIDSNLRFTYQKL